MAGSDLVALPEGAFDDVAARVGASLRGEHNGTGLRIGVAVRACSTAASRCVSSTVRSTRSPRRAPIAATSRWHGRRVRSSSRSWPAPSPLAGKVDAVLCFGAVIRGDTGHYDFVAGECASGIQRVQLDTGVPVVFGVLTTDTVDQALERSEPDETNKGREAALTGIEMVRLLRSGPFS